MRPGQAASDNPGEKRAVDGFVEGM